MICYLLLWNKSYEYHLEILCLYQQILVSEKTYDTWKSIYSDVTEQNMINLRKLAEQQKNQQALSIKTRILKQTPDIKLAESLSPITKKLDVINESTKEIEKVIKESNSQIENNQEIKPVEIESEVDNTKPYIKALPNKSIFSEIMTQTLGSPLSSSSSLKIKSSPSGATILGVPIYTLGRDKLRIRDNNYELTPEVYKDFSHTGYSGKTMKKENDILMMNNIIRDLGYTDIGDRSSKRKHSSQQVFLN